MSQYLFRLHLDDKIFYGAIRNWRDFFPAIRVNQKYRSRLPVFTFEQVIFTKGAKTYIDARHALYGPLTKVIVKLDIWDKSTFSWKDYISGKLAMDRYNKKETETHVGIDPDDFIMNWLNNDEVDLDLTTLTDIHGDAITAFNEELVTVPMAGQVLDLFYKGVSEDLGDKTEDDSVLVGSGVGILYFQLGGFTSEANEMPDEVFNIPCDWVGNTTDNVTPFAELIDQEGDTYHFSYEYEIDYILELEQNGLASSVGTITLSLAHARYDVENDVWLVTIMDSDTVSNNQATTVLSSSMFGTYSGISHVGKLSADELDNDRVRTYLIAKFESSESDHIIREPLIRVDKWRPTVIKKDSSPDTDCKGMLIYEAALRMLQKLTGRNDPLRSPLLGRTDSEVHTYAEDGAASLQLYTNGRYVRQFPSDDYALKGQFYELIKAIHADWCIGVGVITEDDTRYIYIDELQYFWDKDVVAFTITDPDKPEESTALDYIFSVLEFGMDKYETEENGTLGSPHTPRVYTTGLGSLMNNVYDFTQPAVKSSPLIELLRRDPYKDGTEKDNKHDNAMVLMDLKRDGSGGYLPVKGSDFTTVTNLANSDTHFNLGSTPRRALQRHLKWIKGGGIQAFNQGETIAIRFTSADGNATVITVKTGDPAGGFTENENVAYDEGDDPLFIPNLHEFKYPLTAVQMASLTANPNQAVEVSSKGRTFKAFLEVDIENFSSKNAAFKLLEAYETE